MVCECMQLQRAHEQYIAQIIIKTSRLPCTFRVRNTPKKKKENENFPFLYKKK